jgi:hypothetical protein
MEIKAFKGYKNRFFFVLRLSKSSSSNILKKSFENASVDLIFVQRLSFRICLIFSNPSHILEENKNYFKQPVYRPKIVQKARPFHFAFLFCFQYWDSAIPGLNLSVSSERCVREWSEVQVSIPSTFYLKLLQTKIPKVQKDWQLDCIFLHFWDLSTKKLRVKC